jgi:hypothetical protein
MEIGDVTVKLDLDNELNFLNQLAYIETQLKEQNKLLDEANRLKKKEIYLKSIELEMDLKRKRHVDFSYNEFIGVINEIQEDVSNHGIF